MEPELVLESKNGTMCECGEKDSDEAVMEKRLYRRHADGRRAPWESIVERYTARSLTYENDIFPAISAVARDYGIKRYLAGLNGETLMLNLVWSAVF